MGFKASPGDAAARPLDVVEQLLESFEWSFSRRGEEELTALVESDYGACELHFRWGQELEALFFACYRALEVKPSSFQEALRLLSGVNERLWLGHFNILEEADCLVFRHTLPVRNCTSGVTEEQLEDLIATALFESEKILPALLLLSSEDQAVRDALPLAMAEVGGEA